RSHRLLAHPCVGFCNPRTPFPRPVYFEVKMKRKEFLLFAVASMAGPDRLFSGSGSDFWNRKDPSEWSSDEVDRLITRSPWAKEITATAPQTVYSQRQPAPAGRGGLSIPGIGGMGLPGAGRRGPSAPGTTPYKGVVRWESAKPVLEALKESLPGE